MVIAASLLTADASDRDAGLSVDKSVIMMAIMAVDDLRGYDQLPVLR